MTYAIHPLEPCNSFGNCSKILGLNLGSIKPSFQAYFYYASFKILCNECKKSEQGIDENESKLLLGPHMP
jgi:hypothetical protein